MARTPFRRWVCSHACALESWSRSYSSRTSSAFELAAIAVQVQQQSVSIRGYAQSSHEGSRVTGPRHYPSLQSTLRNTRGRELLRIVDIAVPNLKHIKEFSVILNALAIDGQWRRAIRLLREMREVGIIPNVIVYNGLLAAVAKDKKVDKALEVLEEMREKRLVPDLASYNHCIGACNAEHWQQALEILAEIPRIGLEEDGTSFENAVMALEEASEWQRCLEVFSEIKRRELKSTSVGYNYALSACRRGGPESGRWRHAFELMQEMAEKNFEPDFRLKQDLEAQSRGLEKAPPPEPSQRRSSPSPDNVWQRKQQLRELREQDKLRQEEKRLERERLEREERERERRERQDPQKSQTPSPSRARSPSPAPTPSPTPTPAPEPKPTPTVSATPKPAEPAKAPVEKKAERMEDSRKDAKRESDSSKPRDVKVEADISSPSKDSRKDAKRESDSSKPRDVKVEADISSPSKAAEVHQKEEQKADRPEPRWEERRPERKDTRPERQGDDRRSERRSDEKKEGRKDERSAGKPKPKLRSPGSYVLPVFAQHDRSNHAERQALIKVISRVQEACGAQTDAEFEAECAEVTGTVRLYASHTPCISCMACFCQFQRLFPKVKLCVDFDDWRDTRRMVEMARREEEHKRRGTSPPDYDCGGLSDMSDEEEPESDDEDASAAAKDAAAESSQAQVVA